MEMESIFMMAGTSLTCTQPESSSLSQEWKISQYFLTSSVLSLFLAMESSLRRSSSEFSGCMSYIILLNKTGFIILMIEYACINFKMQEPYSNKQDEIFDQSPIVTIKRELSSIGVKIRYAVLLLPRFRDDGIKGFKQWDLWGPLLICLFFSLTLALTTESQKYKNDDFINVFLIFWIGAFLAAINCRLLGNKGSLFQTVSSIGYCMVPLTFFGFIVSVLPSGVPIAVKLPLILLSLIWSVASCLIVMKGLVADEKKWLCAYPVFLFYVFMAWYAIVT